MQLVIDNTRRSGNFFDNLLNDNMLVSVYNINKNTDLNELIQENDNFYFQENDNTLNTFIKNNSKYDYINEKNLNNYINPFYEKLFNEQYKNIFLLSLSQYKQYKDFYQEHKKCLIDVNTGKHKFGSIGGGIVIEYKIKNIEDNNLFVCNIYVKCLNCEIKNELIYTTDIKVSDNLLSSYASNCKYGFKFDKVEFYRFMEILNDHKYEDLIISFMSTGLGNIITVQTKDYIYDITNIDNW